MSWKPIEIQYEEVDEFGQGFRVTNYHQGHWDCVKSVTYVNGRGWFHNNHEAAITKYDVNGEIVEETWAREGVLYNIDDLAAFIALSDKDKHAMSQAVTVEYEYFENRNKCQKCQYKTRIASKTWRNMLGEKHRPGNKPAKISTTNCCPRDSQAPNNPIIRMEWFVNDEYHRDDGGPTHLAKATKYNRSIPYFTVKQWHYKGKLHRVDGPSEQHIRPTHTLTSWYLHGTQYGTFEEWLKESPLPMDEKVEMKLRH